MRNENFSNNQPKAHIFAIHYSIKNYMAKLNFQ